MDGTMYCLVDAQGKVYVKGGAQTHADLADEFGLNERECREYRFDLTTRRLLTDRGAPSSDTAVHAFLDQQVGTPEKLTAFAEAGHLAKGVLVNLLKIEDRPPYLEACATIEKTYTEECVAKNDPCLESGCALEKDEICLQPLLNADVEYHKACAAAWSKMFRSPKNRIEAWRN